MQVAPRERADEEDLLAAERSSVLVTLADRSWIDQAKQLFSGAYFNAGWRGDYLLLARDFTDDDARWFTDRGILVEKCEPFFHGPVGGRESVVADRLRLLDVDFKRWKTVVYMDADCIIRASLSDLAGSKGFWATRDVGSEIDSQIITRVSMKRRGISYGRRRKLVGELRKIVPLSAPLFCCGFFVLDTALIVEGLQRRVLDNAIKFQDVNEYGIQLPLNLVFKDWRSLPLLYSLQLEGDTPVYWIRPGGTKGSRPFLHSEIDAITLHFIGSSKPWDPSSAFFEEWRENLERAERIDLNSIPVGNSWSRVRLEERMRVLDVHGLEAPLWRKKVKRMTPSPLQPLYKKVRRRIRRGYRKLAS